MSEAPQPRLRGSESRMRTDSLFRIACVATASISVLILVFLLGSILVQGVPWVSWTLLSAVDEPEAVNGGMRPAIFGTIWVCTLCAMLTLPIGVGTAILLEEFQPRSTAASWLYSIIQLNISNLAGVPSVVYGIIGLTVFVNMFNLFQVPDAPGQPAFETGIEYSYQFMTENLRSIQVPVRGAGAAMPELKSGMLAYDFEGKPVSINVIQPGEELPSDESVLDYTLFSDSEGGPIDSKAWYYFRLPLGRGVLACALTLMLVILPVIIISTQESLRAVPSSLRAGALGLGATPWQVIWNVTLPSAVPGIMTGSILAMSRAIGETAPILLISGIIVMNHAPQHLMDEFTVMPLQIYNWASNPSSEFHGLAAGGILILLLVLLSFNAVAVLIRHQLQRNLS